MIAGDEVEWQKVGRWLPLYNEYRARFNAYKRRLKDVELAQIGAQMNVLFQQSMQNVAKGLQEQQVRQRLLMPGR